MASISNSTVGSRERRIAVLVDELRADAANGLFYHPDPADAERFVQLRRLSAELLAHVDERSADEIESIFSTDRGLRTPWIGVALILNDQQRGLMLVKDPRNGLSRVPHEFVDEAIDPDGGVAALAEQIIPDAQVVPVPHGICDTISAGLPMVHTYYLTYVVDVTFVPPEAITAELVPASEVDESDLDPLTIYLLGGADRTVIDAPFALPVETRGLITAIRSLASQGARETADRYDLDRYERIGTTMDALLAGVSNEAPMRRYHFGRLDVRTPISAAEALILDDAGRILLMRRSDTGQWAMPGGACEVGESSAATAVREVMEELRLEVDIDGLVGIYDNRVIAAPDPGTFVTFLYVAKLTRASDKPQTTAESMEAAWFEPHEIDKLDIFNAHDVKIARALQILASS